MKILLLTPSLAAGEPRGARHAIAARRAFPEAEIIFADTAPADMPSPDPKAFSGLGIRRRTIRYPTRQSGAVALALAKFKIAAGRVAYRLSGRVGEGVFGIRSMGFARMLRLENPDLVIAHNPETLPALRDWARQTNRQAIFDAMEYYSDMGDGQTAIERKAVRQLESDIYPALALLLTTSDRLSGALTREFGATRVRASYNVPHLEPVPQRHKRAGLALYWRNSVIGLGQRGLADVLQALAKTPKDISLYLQGRPSADEAEIARMTESLGISDRVKVLPPFPPGEAVSQAGCFDIGLCLERPGPINHALTVSNKMFDYHMAGLAIITSNMPSLTDVIEQSGGGVSYVAGQSDSLAEAICRLHANPSELNRLRANARTFAERSANLELELDRLANAFQQAARVS